MQTNGIFQAAHLSELKQALTVYSRRHRVVADNIANVETEGYGSRELRFEEMLAGSTRRLAGTRSHAGHLPLGRSAVDETEGQITETGSDFDNGINNVNIDEEMTELATNDLSYRLATRVLSMKYRLLRGAITGQVR